MRRRNSEIVGFLLLTFVITWGAGITLVGKGLSFVGMAPLYAQLIIGGLMLVPAASALIVSRLSRAPLVPYGWRLGSWKDYGMVVVSIPLVYLLSYAVTVLAGLGTLDLSLKTFLRQFSAASAPAIMPPGGAPVVIIGLFLVSTLITPWINSVFAFGEELGWRGFLLPRLMSMGKARAYIALGIIWGLWHAPIVFAGFNYPGYPWLGVIFMTALTTILGSIINELTLWSKSVFLASFVHGAFNSQAYGVWGMVVPDTNPLLGGITGLTGFAAMALWWVLVRKWMAGRK